MRRVYTSKRYPAKVYVKKREEKSKMKNKNMARFIITENVFPTPPFSWSQFHKP